MPRHLTAKSTLEGLKREAKRWLRTLRENVGDAAAQARARLERALPNAPHVPTLRDVQHALAREHGFDGWAALKQHLSGLGERTESELDPAIVARFLEYACPDHHVRGPTAHVRARHAALRLLAKYPQIAHYNFYTAVVCGNLAEVSRVLADDPSAARVPQQAEGPSRSAEGHAGDERRDLGPKQWEPLLFLCFTRLPIDDVANNSVAIARILLDHGANPNAYFMAGGSRYTPLVGVIGEGEEDRPPHVQRDALVRLLLERGAEPYDIQVFYNMHFRGDVLWYVQTVYEHSLKLGRATDWTDPNWEMIGMGGYGPGAYYLLTVAIRENKPDLARWLLDHGANPNVPTYSHPTFAPKMSLYEEAVRRGRDEIAQLLLEHGAQSVPIVLTPSERLTHAAMRMDRDAVHELFDAHPELRQSTTAMFAAAEADRDDVLRLLMDAGISPNVEDDTGQRPLHMAAYVNSLKAARLLIERGADIDPVERNWSNTPLWAAIYSQQADMIALLAPLSHDLAGIAYAGHVERVRALLAENPERARRIEAGYAPLTWLPPDDEQHAMDIATLFVEHGATVSAKNDAGETGADRAERLGLFEVAEYLRAVSKRVSTAGAGSPPLRLTDYELRAQTLLDAYRTGTPEAMERLYRFTWHRRTWAATRSYIQLDLGRAADDPDRERDITLDDARFLIAREHGFSSWSALVDYAAALPEKTGAVASKPVAILAADPTGVRVVQRDRDWDSVLSQVIERRLDGIDAEGQMTDALLEHVSQLEHITVLKIGGSPAVTDDGIRHLSRLTRLRHLEIDGTAVTDHGLAILRDLPELRHFSATWTRISDAGAANLSGCGNLEHVNLIGTACGDGSISALRAKAQLRHFKTGNGVTDAGIPLLHDFPVFKTWLGGELDMGLLSYDNEPNQLALRGSITDRGVAALAGLDGLAGLNLDDSRLAITGAGLAPLLTLPHLAWLAFDAKDDAMPYIASMPHLRFLGCQDTEATDDGWVALGKSTTIERIWGRRCYGLADRGFKALSFMPALRSLAASCKNVSDSALAAFPNFPALRELMPMDVPDEGYRHIGQCSELEALILMYCRETTDRSTEHIVGLSKLRKYFASYNKITDRSLELLARIESLEEVGLSAVAGVTNAGVAALATLPRLREVRLSGNRLTPEVKTLFSPNVHVHYEL